ncbi:MAG TPA: pilus assembly protein PilM, partial [Chloroflexi bacterium]|nr:pilus assembly protein PilM [Chloroflexota bacterium]
MALFSRATHPRDVVTLYAESTDLRYLATEGGRVSRWGSVPLPEGLVTEGLITDAAEMGRIIDELFQEQALLRKRVITGICALRSIPRLLTLPRLQASLLEEAISREAKKEMPISLDDLYLSWQSMPDGGEQQRIYLLGVPRELVDAQIHTLEAAGIPPFSMDLKPLALIRAVKQPETVIISMEEDMLDIVLVVEYLPAIMRTFSLEREQLDITGKLDRLVQEVVQTVRFYNDSHTSAPIRPEATIYAVGHLLEDREHIDYLR